MDWIVFYLQTLKKILPYLLLSYLSKQPPRTHNGTRFVFYRDIIGNLLLLSFTSGCIHFRSFFVKFTNLRNMHQEIHLRMLSYESFDEDV